MENWRDVEHDQQTEVLIALKRSHSSQFFLASVVSSSYFYEWKEGTFLNLKYV